MPKNNPMEKFIISVSPQTRLKAMLDSLIEASADLFSLTKTGTIKNVKTPQVAPSIDMTILPSNFDRSRLLGRIVISILGATWGVLTFFIVPVLVSENKSALASIKESSIAFKRVWGETLIMNFSMGLFFGIVYLLGFVACLAIFIATLFLGNFYVILTAAFLAIIFFVVTAVISSTLNAIFKVVLYEYARYGRMPANFTPKLILNAI